MSATAIFSSNSEAKFIEFLQANSLLTKEQLSTVENTRQELHLDTLTTLSRYGFIADDALFNAVAECFSLSLINTIKNCPLAQKVIESCQQLNLDLDWWLNSNAFPVIDNEQYYLFTDKPFSPNWQASLRSLNPAINWQLQLLTPAMAVSVFDDIARERAVSELFGQVGNDLATLAEEAPVINLVNSVIERAIYAEASDIHVEAGSNKMSIRFRIDGKLSEFMQQPASRFQAIASRIKLLAELDIAERRLPQDGRFTTRAGKYEYDVRVSTAPDVRGESIVMRLLPKQRDELSIDGLGFEPDHLVQIREWGKLSNGIVLVTGPTGSGKSTTLYALLADVKTGDEKIVTVEDPVEYQLEGITQVQAKAEIGYTFARALRTFLRQDPDIIMVGEIRDKETADIAIQSSLTGHLVLSTLHTNDACSVFPRLADIGVEPYLTAATVQGVQAQRLVRKLCHHCAAPAKAPTFISDTEQLAQATQDLDTPQWKHPVGCNQCHGRGYKGRIGIYELIPVDSKLRQLVSEQAPVNDIRAMARANGHRSLLADGLRKAARGLTSVEEVLRVCSTNEDE